MPSIRFRHVIGGSLSFAFSTRTGRTDSPPFPATLTTPALDRRSLRWFGTSPCRAIPEGLPPSLAQHRLSSSIFYIDPSLRSCHTVIGKAEDDHLTACTPQSPLPDPAVKDGVEVDVGEQR